jgi:hypothetical protein
MEDVQLQKEDCKGHYTAVETRHNLQQELHTENVAIMATGRPAST